MLYTLTQSVYNSYKYCVCLWLTGDGLLSTVDSPLMCTDATVHKKINIVICEFLLNVFLKLRRLLREY